MFKMMLFASAAIAAGAFAATDSYSWGNVRFEGGGFVDGIVPSRTQKDLVYIRTDVGGAYRWNATTEHWIPLMDWITEQDRGLYGTQALALDPNDPARLYILAGTSYFSNGKTMILRSDDYGARQRARPQFGRKARGRSAERGCHLLRHEHFRPFPQRGFGQDLDARRGHQGAFRRVAHQ